MVSLQEAVGNVVVLIESRYHLILKEMVPSPRTQDSTFCLLRRVTKWQCGKHNHAHSHEQILSNLLCFWEQYQVKLKHIFSLGHNKIKSTLTLTELS